jgi:hypothetical protein
MEQRQKETEEELNNILLPQQRDRLKQITFQMQNRGSVTGRGVAEALGLTEEQREKLQAKDRELQTEINKKIAELRAEGREQLLKELTPEQQAKYKELVGDQFEFQGGFGGFGQGGRREGGRGGRRGGDGQGGEGGNRRPDA